jgi:choline-sulfatase
VIAGTWGFSRVALAAVAVVALLSCSEAGREVGPLDPVAPCAELSWDGAERRPDLVLVLNDTMRRDRVGFYGGPAQTPVFDRLARENLAFTHAYSAAPWTKPSIASLFTGLHPSQHGVLSHPALRGDRGGEALETDILSDDLTTLAEVLQSAGYETAAFVGNPWLRPEFGFAQGFDHFDNSFASNVVSGRVVADAALAWLRSRSADRPYFLYVHTMDTHAPYPTLSMEDVRAVGEGAAQEEPLPEPARSSVRQALRLDDGRPLAAAGIPPSRALLLRAYDRGVEAFDHALGRLLDGLEAREGPPPALIVTSDHGEALFERGWGKHGHALFENEVGVPLAARLPGVEASGPVSCPVAGIDLMASLCRYLGAACPEHDFGVSFLGGGDGAERWIVSEGVIRQPEHRSIRNRAWSLMREPGGRPVTPVPDPWSLYRRADDPDERANRLGSAESEGADVAELRDAIAGAVPPFDAPAAGRAPVDGATRERLEALGYLDEP